jgi:hypothetical protein
MRNYWIPAFAGMTKAGVFDFLPSHYHPKNIPLTKNSRKSIKEDFNHSPFSKGGMGNFRLQPFPLF